MFSLDAFDVFGSLPASLALWAFVAVVLLYFARSPAHRTFRATGRAIHNGLRLTARSLVLAEQGLSQRNREVLFGSGADAVEHDLDREFERIGKTVERDVSQLPGLQRQLAEQISALDEDYRASSVVPPSPPGWVAAVEAVADLSRQGDAPVASILKEIHKSTAAQHDASLVAYREAVAERHRRLDRMLPRWRHVGTALEQTRKKAATLLQRAQTIDRHMGMYREIRSCTDAAHRELTSSNLTQFFVAGLALVIAVGGAIINFNLIALPMSEMVGGGSYIGSWKTSDVAALVIILVEVAMGLYLMEALRITRLFPVIGQMDDRTRVRMAWVTFSILLVLAGIESSLALMRDRIAADNMALRQSLSAVQPIETPGSMIPTIGQMVMGFILPFALMFVGIPLETFVNSSRNVLGAGLAIALRGAAFLLRLLGNAADAVAELMVHLYDVVIFLPLWLERQFRGHGSETAAETAPTPKVAQRWEDLPIVQSADETPADAPEDAQEREVLS